MPKKRAVVRDRTSGGASDLLLARRERDAARKLVAAQQVEQLENRVSTLTAAAKRAASENATLTTRMAQLEQALNDACTAPRFEEADAQAKSGASDEPTSESLSGYDAALARVPVLDRCKKAQQHYDACLAHDDKFNLMTGLDGDVFKRQLAVFAPFIESTTNTGAKAIYKLDTGEGGGRRGQGGRRQLRGRRGPRPENLGAAWVEDENDSDVVVPAPPVDRIPNLGAFTKSLADRDKANAKAHTMPHGHCGSRRCKESGVRRLRRSVTAENEKTMKAVAVCDI